ncbi:MAG TPA: hypothetical protein VNA68_00205 [Candidatus Dormibacteraeota bacterium]|nr:hypothetical protein [Candidatus Dormibacteraeota bacterium]
MKNLLTAIIITPFLVAAVLGTNVSLVAYAQSSKNAPSAQNAENPENKVVCNDRRGVFVGTGGLFGTATCVGDQNTNPIFVFIKALANFMLGLLGLMLVAVIIYAGFRYIISGGSPDDIKAAKKQLQQAATGLVLLLIMAAFLNLIGVT